MTHKESIEKLTNSVNAILNFRADEVLSLETWGDEYWVADAKEKLDRLQILLNPIPDLPLFLLPELSVTKLFEKFKPIENALKKLEQHNSNTVGDWEHPSDYFRLIRASVDNVYPVLVEHLSYLSLVQ